jgi:hypothetical protein
MFFLDYLYALPENTTGIDDIAVQTIGIVPGFVHFILLFMFLVIFIGGISRQKTRLGSADYSAWSVVASISTLILALLFSVIQGFLGLDILIVTLCLCLGSAVWFFLDRRASEV